MDGLSTVYAVSTGQLPSGVAIIRISGSRAADALAEFGIGLPVPRKLCLTEIQLRSGLIDTAMVAWFPGPSSFTGEDVVELHIHGSRALANAIMGQLGDMRGLRPAEAGEFSRRAFINGKMSLTEAEGLADLLVAETQAQLELSRQATSGRIQAQYDVWRQRLLAIRARVEADLDFSDEGDVSDVDSEALRHQIDELSRDVKAHLDRFAAGEIVRVGFRVAVVGRPNAGKSSLLNALARRDVAIVSAEAGTTRDIIEVPLDLAGRKIVLFDTAGVRETSSDVEREGIRRALAEARRADLVLSLRAADDPSAWLELDVADELRVATKVDLGRFEGSAIEISVYENYGIDKLLAILGARAAVAAGTGGELVPSTERQRVHLQSAVRELNDSAESPSLDIMAEHLRLASGSIGRLVGEIDVEDVLGAIFSSFCIGK